MSKRKLTDEEQALWRHVAGGVEPLGVRRRRRAEEPPEDASEEPASKQAPARREPPTAASKPEPPKPKAPDLPEVRPGASAGLDKRTALRLRRGQLRPEARVDLHGHTQSEAHATLDRFITDSHLAGRRCVLVITGKGSVQDPQGGVLRQMTPRWLNQPSMRGKVLAIEHAQPKDGGHGALYVLLKRKR